MKVSEHDDGVLEAVNKLPKGERRFLYRMGTVVLVSLFLFAVLMHTSGYSFSGGRLAVDWDEEFDDGPNKAVADADAAGVAPEAAPAPADQVSRVPSPPGAAEPGQDNAAAAAASTRRAMGGRRPGEGVPDASGRFKVIAYSLFARRGTVPDEMFTGGLIHNLRLKVRTFPEWQVRVYLGDNVAEEYAEMLVRLGCQVVRMPFEAGKWMDGMFWRFRVADDPTVSRFLVRDLDGRLSARDAAAVEEWVRDGTAFHTVRDNPAHTIAVMGGMWGGVGQMMRFARPLDQGPAPPSLGKLADNWSGRKRSKGEDQAFLATVWPMFKRNATNHDTAGLPRRFCDGGNPERCHELPTETADTSFCADEGKLCYYFIGAAFGADRAAEDTYDCSKPSKDSFPWCPYLKMHYADQYREMTGDELPARWGGPGPEA